MRIFAVIVLLAVLALGSFVLMQNDSSVEKVDPPLLTQTDVEALPRPEDAPVSLNTTSGDAPFVEERDFISLDEPPSGMNRQSMYAAKDRMLAESGRAAEYNDAWVDMLSKIIRDEDAEPVGRDYALQHLHTAVKRRTTAQPEWLGSATAHRAHETFQYALSNQKSSLPGTALLGLRDLEDQWPDFTPKGWLEQAVDLALDEETALVSRITALRVAAESGREEVLPMARTWAELRQPGRTIPALATLGDVGAAQDLAWMEVTLSNEPPEWMKPALRGAEQRLLARLHNDQGDR